LHTHRLDARCQTALEQMAALGAPAEVVSPAVMAAAAGTQTPPGLLAIVPQPCWTAPAPGWVLVLDQISDPGNLGTILRTADAAGMDAVYLMPGTVDAYNPKVVRAGMGAHFHMPLLETSWEALPAQLGSARLYLAEAHDGQPYTEVHWRAPCALIIGSEASGPSQAARALAHAIVHIPMAGRAESLNASVAAGILIFEAARQRQTAAAPDGQLAL
jgi:TrmH family RNA methyltransferase